MKPFVWQWTYLVPILAIVIGLLVYYNPYKSSTNPGKNQECGRCLFFCGLFILLWLFTFGGVLR